MKQETLGYFIGSKAFSFPNLGGGKKQYNEDHQYDQGQTWSPKAGGEIDSPGGRPQNPRGNAEKAWHEELIILLGMSYSAANYIMDDSHAAIKVMRKDGCCWQWWDEDVTPDGFYKLHLWASRNSQSSLQDN